MHFCYPLSWISTPAFNCNASLTQHYLTAAIFLSRVSSVPFATYLVITPLFSWFAFLLQQSHLCSSTLYSLNMIVPICLLHTAWFALPCLIFYALLTLLHYSRSTLLFSTAIWSFFSVPHHFSPLVSTVILLAVIVLLSSSLYASLLFIFLCSSQLLLLESFLLLSALHTLIVLAWLSLAWLGSARLA